MLLMPLDALDAFSGRRIGQYSIVHLMLSLELYLKVSGHPNADAKGKDMGKRNFPICTAFS